MSALLRPSVWPRQVLIGLVQVYRWTLKPWLGNACRFEPTCSAYALEALQRHGAIRGTALSGWRLARCHPWCQGGLDPVPDRPFQRAVEPADRPVEAGLFTRLPGIRGTPAARPTTFRDLP